MREIDEGDQTILVERDGSTWWYGWAALVTALPLPTVLPTAAAGRRSGSRLDATVFSVGNRVRLSGVFQDEKDAAAGPLKSGDIGTIVGMDASEMPCEVQAASGVKWWYTARALALESARAEAAPSAVINDNCHALFCHIILLDCEIIVSS